MRLLSARLIVSLIVGVTLVSLCSSYYQVLVQSRGLQKDLQRRAEVLGKVSLETWNAIWSGTRSIPCREPWSSSPTANTWRDWRSMISRGILLLLRQTLSR